MDRRALLTHIVAMTGGALAAPLAAAISGDAPETANPPLGDEALRLAGVLAEHIIPETDTPGALAAGVDRYIVRIVNHFLPETDASAYRNGLAMLNEQAKAAHGMPFMALSAPTQRQRLEALDKRAFAGDAGPLAAFWRSHKALTLAGYYTAEVGATRELRPMPMGPFEADVPYAKVGRAWS
jgi:hypothetical protein